ncbi:Tc5 transposase DNA-binding domain [Phytophthora infestans]|uniref:Tc5 transposase DNA-binding domain n=1 Tax=Phytophthora infestans TaxID=4787 RepID=A0A8S9V1P2_PHYIN|nr:Tc5 transposase DNA-binding domain [Phytophthora infestans]
MKRRREVGSAKTLPDGAEICIFEWLVALRRNGIPVSATMLQLEALDIAAMYYIPSTAFAASSTWMASYLSRYSLSLRTRTRQGQASPADSEDVAQHFAATVLHRIVEECIETVFDADQNAV